ncbi:hypothetical protein bcCo53_001697 (plasmid) [Borrelia coriaceae]|uniref:Uncharacterized protein n=2 Tax=Borrelia coriaceae TaxID=144 RepID=W5SXJ2_9SPIR|nr:hypothetical protein [Borrelia coriaceae]AHH11612.1 hypothetical protein BCO_0900117 [Borrelia coriaceae ATCC 43381]UPA16692.1 hypothetical protein bcCo53_000856 [Borrelia coriaceae]UPA17492.1 hypothetical protein bcCo53_001697 [Borrelia coriaceae]
MNKNVLAVCVLTLLCFLSCHMALLDRLIGVVSERFSEEEYYLGLLKESKEGEEDQSDVIINAGKKFKVLGVVGIPKKGMTQPLQSVSQVGEALNQKQQKVESVVTKVMGSDISNPAEAALESVKNLSENNISTTTVSQSSLEKQLLAQQTEDSSKNIFNKGEEEKRSDKRVIDGAPQSDQPQQVAEPQSVELVQEVEYSAKETESEKIKNEIDSALTQIGSFSDSFNKKLSELEGYKSKISDAKSRVKTLNHHQEAKTVLDEIVVQRFKKDGIVNLEQFVERLSENIMKNISVASALYKEQLDRLVKAKSEAESAKQNSIDSSSDIMSKAKDRLDSAIEEIISGNKSASARSARQKVVKAYGVFEEFIWRVKKIDSIVRAGSYTNLATQWKYGALYLEKFAQKGITYDKLKEDTEREMERFVDNNFDYFLGN